MHPLGLYMVLEQLHWHTISTLVVSALVPQLNAAG